jgi:argininosuccinate synthase
MIAATKIVKMVDQEDSEEYVEVVFHDGTFVALSEEELRNAAVLAERGSLGGDFNLN